MKRITFALLLYAALIAIMSACNVTRTTCTTSSYVSRGDTACIIRCETTEVYDARSNSKPNK